VVGDGLPVRGATRRRRCYYLGVLLAGWVARSCDDALVVCGVYQIASCYYYYYYST